MGRPGLNPIVVAAQRPLREFLTDPILSVACVLLIVVSVGWILVWRRILRDMERAARRRPAQAARRSPRDIWAYPP